MPQLVALSHRELVVECIAVLAEVAMVTIIIITIIMVAGEAAAAVATPIAVTSVRPGYYASVTSRPRKDCSTQVLNTNSKFYFNNTIYSVK